MRILDFLEDDTNKEDNFMQNSKISYKMTELNSFLIEKIGN